MLFKYLTPRPFAIAEIPFTGFYNTDHEHQVDLHFYELLEEVYDRHSTTDPAMPLEFNEFVMHFDYTQAFKRYAKEYANFFCKFLKDTGYCNTGEFYRLTSPREYNFTTDKIDISLSWQDVFSIMLDVDLEVLKNLIKERHSSYSGFISFYPSDIKDWEDLPINFWDENMLGTLVLAILYYPDYSPSKSLEEEFIEYANAEGITQVIFEEGLTNQTSSDLYDKLLEIYDRKFR